MFWSDDENFHVHRIARVMPMKRFLKILRFLHLNDNEKMLPVESPDFDKLFKIRPLIDHLKTKYLVLFSPSRNLAVDESMVAFKGRTSLKQFMPKKPIKRGFKIWVCACSETGYVLTFQVYTGKKKDGSPEEKLGERVVLDLTTPYLGLGHCVYYDNFFSSVALTNKLLEEDTFSCATILPNRVEYPVEELKKDKEIPTHQHDFAQCGDISITKWADRGKKCVSVISSMCNPSETVKVMRSNGKGEREEVTCPSAVSQYNKYMGGVDRFDQHMANYSVAQKSIRWWVKLFYFFFESAIVNSFTMYVQDCKASGIKPINHLRYRSKLVNQLIGTFTSRRKIGYTPGKSRARKKHSPSGRPTIQNSIRLSNVGNHLPQLIQKYRRCAHCSTKAKEKRSNMICSGCNVALCKGCFSLFHKTM
ncbi:piggyBac transposable element-derived protein 4-like isoform X1 [Homalodisca vitripennis]|uniref:piggyBac transposable element-derived protein 4-like isoform X1 n=1 Tax=Homalodisca vitripennis TaxID=197043 RepID=UPI001EEB8C08|nr:piggyBac transposable element-derived protein 4-like isoform X1 [Homalodisca vitripennis]